MRSLAAFFVAILSGMASAQELRHKPSDVGATIDRGGIVDVKPVPARAAKKDAPVLTVATKPSEQLLLAQSVILATSPSRDDLANPITVH